MEHLGEGLVGQKGLPAANVVAVGRAAGLPGQYLADNASQFVVAQLAGDVGRSAVAARADCEQRVVVWAVRIGQCHGVGMLAAGEVPQRVCRLVGLVGVGVCRADLQQPAAGVALQAFCLQAVRVIVCGAKQQAVVGADGHGAGLQS